MAGPHDFREQPPRSILFVPGSRPELAAKAAAGAADAVCLDLEDGVAAAVKPSARAHLAAMAAQLDAAGMPFMVRLNTAADEYTADIGALPPTAAAVVLAKAAGADHLAAVRAGLAERGLAAGMIAMVEDIAGIDAFAAMRAGDADGLAGLTLGAEDLAAELMCAADSRAMQHAFYRLLESARRLDVPLLGFPGSIAEFSDLERYRRQVDAGRDMGAVGAFCIHPRQVEVCNGIFSPSPDDIAWAEEVVAALDAAAAAGQGAAAVRGRMVDRPVAIRARRILDLGRTASD